MLGKTHFVLGMASAILLTQPHTAPEVITALTGGALGGWIVDIDIKNKEMSEKERCDNFYDTIIKATLVSTFLIIDYLIGNGICQYIIDNWNVKVWGALFGLLILSLIGFNTKHRTFTHSILSFGLFTILMYSFCRPAAVPFGIGYASHIIADFFNKLGIQLFFPFKWRPCLKICRSDKKANRVLFWVSLSIDIILGAFLFSKGLIESGQSTNLYLTIVEKKIFKLNIFQIYLILINLFAFLGFERSYKEYLDDCRDAAEKGIAYSYEEYDSRWYFIETWILNLLVFFGGGLGMLLSLVKHLEFPSAYKGKANWWAICYTSILFWSTLYLFICNPVGFEIGKIKVIDPKHIELLVYLIGINAISALTLYTWRKKRFDETDIKHTLIFLLGAMGGTIGAILMVFYTRREGKYYYVKAGFFAMLVSQIVFVMYMLAVGVF